MEESFEEFREKVIEAMRAKMIPEELSQKEETMIRSAFDDEPDGQRRHDWVARDIYIERDFPRR